MDTVNSFVSSLNDILFHQHVVYTLLATGVLFTFWTIFGQYRALTHGVSVVRGKYDEEGDPGAINHFQALSAALSATVGLGNIGGVALAVALGGPGAILWMWVIGVVGMSLKMTEVTQSMLYRNTSDPDNPHGGPMFVVKKGLADAAAGGNKTLCVATGIAFAIVFVWAGWVWGTMPVIIGCSIVALGLLILGIVNGAALGTIIGGIFVITLLISAITGGNMFQAWNVANVTFTYFGIPEIATGIVLAIVVGAVIIGGIKRIGSVAGKLVPFMCLLYLTAGIYVLFLNAGRIPEMIALIFKSGLPEFLGGEPAAASGAFLGGTFGYAAMWGIKRALFSSEAGQGSAPIAHSAAKTDEPVREGVVAGLEPFIDTLVVCTITALVILSSGAYDRPAEANYAAAPEITSIEQIEYTDANGNVVTVKGRVLDGAGDTVQVIAADSSKGTPIEISATAISDRQPLDNEWTLITTGLPAKTDDAKRILRVTDGPGWRDGETVFMVVHADEDLNTGRDLRRITGTVYGNNDTGWRVSWNSLESDKAPSFIDGDDGETDIGVYGDYAGASLTAHAFDRATPGLGMWLVTAAAWLFAISTMISWSYYGEQGMVYLLGESSVIPYKIVYCALIVVSTLGFIQTDAQLDMWTTLGLGVMLVANIPLMLLFSGQAMKAYHEYMGRLKSGQMVAHKAPPITDVIEGEDVKPGHHYDPEK